MSIEVMKQALEALEQVKAERFHPAKVFTHNPSIIALRQAIAEAEKQEPIGYIDANTLHRWDVLKGTKYECEEKCYMPFSRNAPHKTDHLDCSVAVYTTPPQRQPLTDEELLYTYNKLPNWGMDMDNLPNGLRLFARAIEAAHGIGEKA